MWAAILYVAHHATETRTAWNNRVFVIPTGQAPEMAIRVNHIFFLWHGNRSPLVLNYIPEG